MRVAAPPTPPLELERLRRTVRAQLFDRENSPVKIGRFDVVGCLGEGGMGIVYAALDGELGRTVAIKLLRQELSHDQRGGRRLSVEAKALARLSHPNVVSVFDVGEHDGQRFIAMEYVDGQTLRRWCDDARPIAAIVDVFTQAGRGLAAAHAVGLVHRDFKPDNVLVGTDGRARVLDFGLARPPEDDVRDASPPAIDDRGGPLATSLTRDGAVVGTPAYMAPEQHLGDPADARSDQFAFCVALWEAMTGALPFDGSDVRTISLSIVAGRRRGSTTNIPPRLVGLLDRGLALRPESRFETMEALLDELERWDDPVGEDSDPLTTGEMNRVLSGDDATATAVSGLPRLQRSEVDDVLAEAGLSVPRSAAIAPPSSSSLVVVGGAPPTWSTGYRTVVSHAIEVDAMVLPPARALGRTLARVFETEGEVDGDSHSLTWATRSSEVTLEATPTGVRVLLRRNLSKLAKRRRRRWMALAGTAGWLFGLIFVEAIGLMSTNDELAMLFVLTNTVVCTLGGWAIGKRLHARTVEEEQQRLAWAAERVAALPSRST